MHCLVAGCSSNSKKADKKQFSWHAFPLDWDLRKVWISKINRKDYTMNDWRPYHRLCGKHFTEPDFAFPSPSQLISLGIKRKLRLKDGVVPSVFPNIAKARRRRRRAKRIIKQEPLEDECMNEEEIIPGMIPAVSCKVEYIEEAILPVNTVTFYEHSRSVGSQTDIIQTRDVSAQSYSRGKSVAVQTNYGTSKRYLLVRRDLIDLPLNPSTIQLINRSCEELSRNSQQITSEEDPLSFETNKNELIVPDFVIDKWH